MREVELIVVLYKPYYQTWCTLPIWGRLFISKYATSHPWEDWARPGLIYSAHYLGHGRDGTFFWYLKVNFYNISKKHRIEAKHLILYSVKNFEKLFQ